MNWHKLSLPARAGTAGRRLALVAALALAGAILAAYLGQRGPDTSTATAQVGFSRSDVPTQATLAKTREVAAEAVRIAGVKRMTARRLIASSDIQVVAASYVVLFHVHDAHPARARRLADAYARAFVDVRRQRISAAAAPLRTRL